MKPLLSIFVAVVIAFSGMTFVFAAETSDKAEPVGAAVSENAVQENTQSVTQNSEPTETESETEPAAAAPCGTVISSDGNYKLYVYQEGDISYADIIKYLGEDKFPKTTVISEIDGYKIRQIRAKAFCGLKSLRTVKFMGAYFAKGVKSEVLKKGFYNCKKMTTLVVNSYVTLNSKCAGYVNSKKCAKFTALKYNDVTKTQSDVSSKLNYAKTHTVKAIYNVSKNNRNNRKAKLVDFLNGSVFYAKVAGKNVKGWKSSNSKVVSVTSKGKAVVKTKGTTTLSVKVGKLKIKRKFVVTTNPYLTVKGEKVTSVSVDNGETVKLGIKGKAADIDNVYTDTEYAKITSKKNAATLKIKGMRRGKTTVKVNVNGHTIKLKVNVKKNPISDKTMANIADKIGSQVDYSYADSTVMCSAYAFCYAYYQVKGSKITPISVWCPGGCTWYGGTQTYFSSASSMLKAIKASLDKNQACVGLLSIGNSSHHYVTFYDYNGKGTKLSDFKILDPWDGSLTTGEYYGYSRGYGYQAVTINT
ncbi:MAG: hypothetical protein IJ932_03915 [Ruminococcus sp.]|nr:hypothetical protein [Ruminococcus sp.]